MGVCESGHHNKNLKPENQTKNDIKNALTKSIEKNKCPELDKYDRSMFISGKKSEYSQFNNKTVSMFSAEKTEEEVIVKGEINKECKNKEEDFDNNSFKNLIKIMAV